MVNGTAVWDGGAVTTSRITQSQTTLLDQWVGPSSGTQGETKERMTEQNPEKEDDTRPDTDKERLIDVLHKKQRVMLLQI